MSESRIVIPDNLKSFLRVESCKDFPISRFFPTQNQDELLDKIVGAKVDALELAALGTEENPQYYPNTCLLYGPPGTGKTTFGRWVSYMLDLDFCYVKFSNITDGILGSTQRNIDAIFNFMASVQDDCLFMLDEIDYIATRRGNESATTGGEMTRSTMTIMEQLNYYESQKVENILIAATNRVDTLDEALVNRFSIVAKLDIMTNNEKCTYIENYLNKLSEKVDYNKKQIRDYVAKNYELSIRIIEKEIKQALMAWLKNGKKDFHLEHYESQKYY